MYYPIIVAKFDIVNYGSFNRDISNYGKDFYKINSAILSEEPISLVKREIIDYNGEKFSRMSIDSFSLDKSLKNIENKKIIELNLKYDINQSEFNDIDKGYINFIGLYKDLNKYMFFIADIDFENITNTIYYKNIYSFYSNSFINDKLKDGFKSFIEKDYKQYIPVKKMGVDFLNEI